MQMFSAEVHGLEINAVIYDEMKQNNNMITTARVAELGFSRALLTVYVKNGLLERSRHGVYTLPDTVHDDMYTLMLRSKRIIFSHDTALFLNGLSERTPFIHTVTIPSNSVLPNSLKGECNCYYIKPELHEIGLITKTTTLGNEVRCYNPERTICDILRSRNRLDEETVVSAIKNYASFDKKDLNLLSVYAQQFKVSRELKKYLEVLL
jgi:predicted transcriptional regulator of viral defense system